MSSAGSKDATDLVVIGAGPKAVAIAAKAFALDTLGVRVPKIRIFERDSVAANWKKDTGFTDGNLELGTSPEKDIGFPYESNSWGDGSDAKVNDMMRGFSWQSYLISTGKYGSWVDRGNPRPSHSQWADYLTWVLGVVTRSSKVVELGFASCQSIGIGDKWNLKLEDSNGKVFETDASALVLTGPGKLKLPHDIPDDPRVLDFQSFWTSPPDLRNSQKIKRIGIIGDGESAASVALSVAKRGGGVQVDIITPAAMSYSRGESFAENQMFTDPIKGRWLDLTYADRQKFIERTDRGVFSTTVKSVLDQADFIHVVPGRSDRIAVDSDDGIAVDVIYNEKLIKKNYDFVVVAIGFDPLGFLEQKTCEATRAKILDRTGLREWSARAIEENIASDLSLADLEPKLHLPMLGGLAQGPGYPNLSCLGRLSDQILKSYVI